MTVVPDQRVPYQLAKDMRATIFVRRADGKYVAEEWFIPAGWWLASPLVVEGGAK